MGGGFRFRYKSAYVRKSFPEKVPKHKPVVKLTEAEINQAMDQLLDRPKSSRRNVITKPVGVDFD